MANKYSLKIYFGDHLLERFEKRSKVSLKEILSHDRFYHAGETGPFGEVVKNPDRFEMHDYTMQKIFDGNIKELEVFMRGLK